MPTTIVQTANSTLRFRCRKDGLFHLTPGQPKRRICGSIRILGLATEEHGVGLLVVVRVKDDNGEAVIHYIKRGDFRRQDAVMTFLSERWVDCPVSKEDEGLLFAYLKSFKPKPKYVLLPRPGWFQDAYVFPERMIGKRPRPFPKYTPTLRRRGGLPEVGGCMEEWTNKVARLAKYSDRITFAMSISFAALLLNRVKGIESGGFHFFATTTVGKTTLQIAAESIHGWPKRGDLPHWGLTATGLDELAAEHCDRILVLDEMARLGLPAVAVPKARDASFRLASGQGTLRSMHYGAKGNPTNWRVFMLSSGEKGITENAMLAGESRLQGDQVRLIDVPAAASASHGVFNRLPPGHADIRKAAQALEDAATANFGHPSREFVAGLVKNLEGNLRLVQNWRLRFIRKASVPADGWEQRFAGRFALAYAAGMLARRLKLVPWSAKWVFKANKRCYRAARRAIPDQDRLLQEAVTAVQCQLNAAHGLLDLRRGKPKPGAAQTATGFIKSDGNGKHFYAVRPNVLEAWIGPKLNVRTFASYLDQQGLLVKTKRSVLTKPVLIPGIKGKPRYYCLRSAICIPAESV